MDFDNKKFEEELNFKNVKDNPVRWFGAIYPYFIIVILIIGSIYVSKLNTINLNKIPPAIVDSTKLWYELAAVKGSIQKGVDVSIIKSPTKDLIEKGKTAFTTTCTACHGNDGKGDGPAGAALNPKPRNFTAKEGWINGRKFSDIYKTLQEGIKGSAMTAYEFLPIEDRISIVHYIRTLANDFPPVTDEEIAFLNSNYGLTGDRITPSQIPVARAISLIDKEKSTDSEKLKNIVNSIITDNSASANLFKDVATKPDMAVSQLMNNESWKLSPEMFISVVVHNGQYGGFSPAVANYSKEQIIELYNFLKAKI